MDKNCLDNPKWGQEDVFPSNPEVADILGRADLDFENFYLFVFLDPKFLDFQVPRSPNSQIPKFPDFQTPPPAPPDELSDPNLAPLPTHPGIKYVAGSPCCDFSFCRFFLFFGDFMEVRYWMSKNLSPR